jgi:uncharacterized protein (TIGR03437 family)
MRKVGLFAFICLHARLIALPLWFEPNQGQTSPSVQFQSCNIYLRATSAAIRIHASPIVLTLEHANAKARAEALDRLPGVSNYYLGNDRKKWRTGVPHFARVRYHDVYPGIDLVYYGTAQEKLEYDFILKPRADSSVIRIAYNRPVRRDSNGDLLIAGLRQHRPKVYQDGREIACDYIVDHEHRVQLALAKYDHAESLTIDPVIEYSTYLGGNGNDFAKGIAVDASGSAYITGWLESPKYPNLDPFQQTSGTGRDIVVAKFTPAGDALAFYTYVGGSGLNSGEAVTLDASGNIYVTGFTQSVDFPTKNAAQPNFGGGFENAVIFKLSPAGKLVYSTYLGGNNQERAFGIAVDATGAVFVSGFTFSIDFPTTNAIQPRVAGRPAAFLAKLSPTGDQFLFSTYLGGSGRNYGSGLTLDATGNPIMVGETESIDFPLQNPLQSSLLSQHGSPFNGFITKLSSAGDKILYSTYFCGAAQSALSKIALDSSGAMYVLGTTTTSGFPVKNPIQATFGGGLTDLVIAKLTPAGDSIVYATYFGGNDEEIALGLAVDAIGNVYVTGSTDSPDFPTKNSIQPFVGSTHSFKDDAFVVHISPSGSLLYSTIIGGNGSDAGTGIALDSQGRVYVTGPTNSDDFPTKNPLQAAFGGGPDDMFYLRLAPETAPPPPFNASPATLQFRFVIGGPTPSPQTVSVTSAGGGPLSFNPSSTVSWLKFTPSSGTTPATLISSVDPSGLNPGTYTGSIQIGSQTSIQVNLTVLASAPAVTGISPTSVPVGSETTVITISGSGFQQGAAVQLNGVAFPTTFVDSGTLRITLDKSNLTQAATLPFTVVNPQSAPSSPVTFTIGTPAPGFTAAGVVNAATFTGGPVAPGEIITIFGTNLSGGVSFDGTPAMPVFASPTQVNVTVPYSVTGPATVLQMGASSVQLQVAPSAPGIFAAVSVGDNVIVLYATGCGALTNDDLPRCALPVSVTVNGEPAQVLYAGIAPGLVQGANQINIQRPDGIASGQLTIVLTAGDVSSKPVSFTLP